MVNLSPIKFYVGRLSGKSGKKNSGFEMKKLLYGFFILVLLTNCSDTINENEDFVDKRVLGEWGEITSIENSKHPGPSERFNGIQILESEMKYLAIEHSTGEIKLVQNSNHKELKFIGNNQFETETLALYGTHKELITYILWLSSN